MWVTLSGAQLPIAVKWSSGLAASTSTQHRSFSWWKPCSTFSQRRDSRHSFLPGSVFFSKGKETVFQSSMFKCYVNVKEAKSASQALKSCQSPSEHIPSEWSFWKSTWSYPPKRYSYQIFKGFIRDSYHFLSMFLSRSLMKSRCWREYGRGVRLVMPRGWRSFEYWRCCAKCLSKNRVSWSKDKMSWFWTCLFLGADVP